MNEDIVIWGAGTWGDVAYHYYKRKGNIVCYIDNDQKKWGRILNGIRIYPPSILKSKKVKVILALKSGIKIIIKQLEEYEIESYVVFQVREEVYSKQNICHRERKIEEDICIVAFSGGLGNQMFQYALLRNLEISEKKVLADLKAYTQVGMMPFQLMDVFSNITLVQCTEEQKKNLVKYNTKETGKNKKFVIYRESYEYGITKEADLSLLDITGGIINGLHQNYIFPNRIREKLLEDFTFNVAYENKLKILHDCIIKQNAVSIHVRRGDYLTGNNQWLYGDICTKEYYENAVKYIKEKIGECILYVFSNDVEWIKMRHYMKGVIYVEPGMFDNYQDWYDMYLMSICKHNIIANSSFSWWGAWLNQNENKIVVAPKTWINAFKYKDIYPKEWIKM